MVRSIIGVIVGYAVWTAIWLGGNAILFGDMSEQVAAGEPLTAVGSLLAILALSVVCSIIGGFATGAIAKSAKVVLIMAILLVVTGIAVQASVWSLMPVWYHLAFLVLLVPVAVAGGKFAKAA